MIYLEREDIMAESNAYYSNKAAEKLRTDAINSATPEELTLMLYEGALKFANVALMEIEKNNKKKENGEIPNYELINDNSQRIRAIMRELQRTLDFKYEIANTFNDYYEFILRRLHEATIKKDAEVMKEVTFLLRSIRDTWKEAMQIARTENAAKRK